MPRVMRLFVQYFVGGGEEWCFFVDVVGHSAGVCIVYVMRLREITELALIILES